VLSSNGKATLYSAKKGTVEIHPEVIGFAHTSYNAGSAETVDVDLKIKPAIGPYDSGVPEHTDAIKLRVGGLPRPPRPGDPGFSVKVARNTPNLACTWHREADFVPGQNGYPVDPNSYSYARAAVLTLTPPDLAEPWCEGRYSATVLSPSGKKLATSSFDVAASAP